MIEYFNELAECVCLSNLLMFHIIALAGIQGRPGFLILVPDIFRHARKNKELRNKKGMWFISCI